VTYLHTIDKGRPPPPALILPVTDRRTPFIYNARHAPTDPLISSLSTTMLALVLRPRRRASGLLLALALTTLALTSESIYAVTETSQTDRIRRQLNSKRLDAWPGLGGPRIVSAPFYRRRHTHSSLRERNENAPRQIEQCERGFEDISASNKSSTVHRSISTPGILVWGPPEGYQQESTPYGLFETLLRSGHRRDYEPGRLAQSSRPHTPVAAGMGSINRISSWLPRSKWKASMSEILPLRKS
jgi:hypothetical protein